MTPLIFSPSNPNLDPGILTVQRRCFEHFGIPLYQFQSDLNHGEAMDWVVGSRLGLCDVVAVFDADALCTDPVWLKKTMERCLESHLVVGGLHNANHTAVDGVMSEDYASPACIVFSMETYRKVLREVSKPLDHAQVGQAYWDPAQMFCHTVRKQGGIVEMLEPVNVRQAVWATKSGPMLGPGTDYGPCYHEWESRLNKPGAVRHLTAHLEAAIARSG